jgi:hypothetical protein
MLLPLVLDVQVDSEYIGVVLSHFIVRLCVSG